MKLSIIIPAYNAALYIDKCIRSCENQDISQEDYEIIIVDDGSIDNTKECIEQLQKDFNNIIYIYQVNSRQGAARNNGLNHAKGKYIWYVDADDWIESNCLCEIINKLEEDNLTALAVRHAKYYGEKLKLWVALDEKTINSGKDVLQGKKMLVSPTYCIWDRTYLLNQQLFFLENIFHEDSEIYPRMYYNAERIGFYNRVCYYIYESDNSTTRSNNPQRAIDVITVVQHLQRFCDAIVSKEIKKAIRQYICSMINMSLYNTYTLSDENIKELNNHWAKNRILFNNLTKCNICKYKIEGFLFKLFPNHVSQIYQLMQKWNSDPGKMKQQSNLR